MLDGFFSPRSVAVVGAAREAGKVGRIVLDNLLTGGFSGEVYPVNPKAAEIDGRTAYPSVRDLPGPCDLAVIVIPASLVPDVVSDCGEVGIPAVIVVSAGFKEAGREGNRLEAEVVRRAKEHGIRLLGPNCLGLISTPAGLNASFAGAMPPAGGVSFMSQSGALGTAILDHALGEGVGLAHFVSLGNKADVSENDLLAAWDEDPSSEVIAAYIESVSDGERFVEVASRVTRRLPVVALKAGVSDAGARAVSSHTGSLAGSDAAYDAAFRRAGIIRARSVQELFDHATGFASQPLPRGPGLVILTNAGGPAVMATDACERYDVPLASLENETIETLRSVLPAAASLYNPVDILGDAGSERYQQAMRLLCEDPNVRAVLVILTPQAMTGPSETARVIIEESRRCGLPTLACFMGRQSVEDAWNLLRDAGVPNFPFPERCVATLGAMQEYARIRQAPDRDVPRVDADRTLVGERIQVTRDRGGSFVTEQSAADIVRAYGVPVPSGRVATGLDEALAVADEVGYPLVLKIASPDILHKSDVGGIRVGIGDPQELAGAYDDVLAQARRYMPSATIDGVHVQKLVAGGHEVIVGVDRDPQFGPMLMFGMGGVYVEILRDVTFRLCPVSIEEAREMISEIRSYGLLRGARGQAPADIDAIADVLVRVSVLATDFPEIVELDINPLIVSDAGGGAVAADVRIGIGGTS